jgi:hypothetical protein
MSTVDIATGYGLDDGMFGVRFQVEAGNFSLRHHFQTGSAAHLASYPVGTRGSFPGSKATDAWSWHPASSSAEVKECVELCYHLVNHRDNSTFIFMNLLVMRLSGRSLPCLDLCCRPLHSPDVFVLIAWKQSCQPFNLLYSIEQWWVIWHLLCF